MPVLDEKAATPHEVATTTRLPARPACPLCSGSDVRVLFARHGYPVLQCAACGAQFLNPQPTDATLAEIYNAGYFLGDPTPENEARVEKLKRATASLYLDRLTARLGQAAGALLELGCGRGEFLLEAQARGFTVNGVEISPAAVAAANRRLGADRVRAGTIETAPFPEGSFDVVVFADVIEHVRNPLSFLHRVRALLKGGGMVLLVTPALDSFSARLLGRRWMEYKVEHLHYFSRSSIRMALERTGFRDIAIAPNAKVLSLEYVHHHFQRFPVPLLTPLVRLLRAVAPGSLAHRAWRVPASGLMVTART